jgi:hypothetical protein
MTSLACENAPQGSLRASDNISLPDIVIDNDDDNGFTAIVVDDEENNTEEEIAPAAPATQVLGATRDRAALANEIVERLYVNALNRPSDANGKTYWVNMILADNDNLDMVIEGFLGSAEFNARNLSDSEFVNVLYRVMFNRRPSASERRQWTNALANGSSRNDVIDAFLDSNEFETMTSVYGF